MEAQSIRCRIGLSGAKAITLNRGILHPGGFSFAQPTRRRRLAQIARSTTSASSAMQPWPTGSATSGLMSMLSIRSPRSWASRPCPVRCFRLRPSFRPGRCSRPNPRFPRSPNRCPRLDHCPRSARLRCHRRCHRTAGRPPPRDEEHAEHEGDRQGPRAEALQEHPVLLSCCTIQNREKLVNKSPVARGEGVEGSTLARIRLTATDGERSQGLPSPRPSLASGRGWKIPPCDPLPREWSVGEG